MTHKKILTQKLCTPKNSTREFPELRYMYFIMLYKTIIENLATEQGIHVDVQVQVHVYTAGIQCIYSITGTNHERKNFLDVRQEKMEQSRE